MEKLTDSQLYALNYALFEGGEDPEAENIVKTLCPCDFALNDVATVRECFFNIITCEECWRKALEEAYK